MRTPGHLFTKTATVQTPTHTTQGDGGTDTSFASTYSNVACDIQPASSSDSLRYRVELGLRVSTGYFYPDLNTGSPVAILKDWRIVCENKVYRVVGDAMDPTGRGILQTCTLEETT